MANGTLTLLGDFVFEGRPVRLARNGGLWWVLADVCDVTEHSDPSAAARRLDPDEKGTTTIRTPSGDQEMLIISEPGLYKLLMTSRKPIAKRFDRWVRHEVLPSIRKTGSYVTPTKAPQMEDMTQIFDQALDKKLGPMRADINEIKTTLRVVVDNTDKGRKYATAETVRLHHKVIWHHFYGLCPCEIRCDIQIANEGGFIDGVWQHHHQFGKHDNRPEAMIPLAENCHQRITNDIAARTRFSQNAFPQFQDLLSRIPIKQLTLELKPAKD